MTTRETVWNVPIGPVIGVFLLLAALDHLLMAAPGVWPWYRANLQRGINYARWWEYSVSASVMMVLIALITGVSDIGAIVAIFGVNAAMIFFGLVMEIFNRDRERVNWTPFLLGCVAGIVPWIVIVYQVAGSARRATGDGVPAFVVRHHRLALHPLQLLRGEHGAPVPADRQVARLSVRRKGVHPPQPHRQKRARLADLRQHPHQIGQCQSKLFVQSRRPLSSVV